MPVEEYLQAGVSPVGAMKEYRECVGMTEKPGSLSINVNQTVDTRNDGIGSSEELLRSVLEQMQAEQVGSNSSGSATTEAAPRDPEE